MCLINFHHDLLIAVMAQTFEGFNHLCTNAYDMEIHLSKHKEMLKELVKPEI